MAKLFAIISVILMMWWSWSFSANFLLLQRITTSHSILVIWVTIVQATINPFCHLANPAFSIDIQLATWIGGWFNWSIQTSHYSFFAIQYFFTTAKQILAFWLVCLRKKSFFTLVVWKKDRLGSFWETQQLAKNTSLVMWWWLACLYDCDLTWLDYCDSNFLLVSIFILKIFSPNISLSFHL